MTRLSRVRNALAAMSDAELHAMRAAADLSSGLASGLFAWLEHATGWEIDRREQQHYLLRFPSESMEVDEVPEALLALAALDATFKARGASPEITELLAASAELVERCLLMH